MTNTTFSMTDISSKGLPSTAIISAILPSSREPNVSDILSNFAVSIVADLIASIFGDSGMHARAAISTNSLPLGVAVEVDAIFELN